MNSYFLSIEGFYPSITLLFVSLIGNKRGRRKAFPLGKGKAKGGQRPLGIGQLGSLIPLRKRIMEEMTVERERKRVMNSTTTIAAQ